MFLYSTMQFRQTRYAIRLGLLQRHMKCTWHVITKKKHNPKSTATPKHYSSPVTQREICKRYVKENIVRKSEKTISISSIVIYTCPVMPVIRAIFWLGLDAIFVNVNVVKENPVVTWWKREYTTSVVVLKIYNKGNPLHNGT